MNNSPVEVISRPDAIAFLEAPRPVWVDVVGQLTKTKLVRGRGPGSVVDVINYGLRNTHGKLVAVMRVGMPPYGGAPAKAAVGEALANKCLYLMRLSAIGISADDLREFVRGAIQRLPADTGGRFHYLLSLDNPDDILIDGPDGFLAHNRAVTGQVYINSGALHAGITGNRRQATRYVAADGNIKSVYRNGENITADIEALGLRVIREGAKHRFVWVLAAQGPEYIRLRKLLPAWVTDPRWGENVGWTQPRLLFNPFTCPITA
jgi:hypothetical protein